MVNVVGDPAKISLEAKCHVAARIFGKSPETMKEIMKIYDIKMSLMSETFASSVRNPVSPTLETRQTRGQNQNELLNSSVLNSSSDPPQVSSIEQVSNQHVESLAQTPPAIPPRHPNNPNKTDTLTDIISMIHSPK